MFRQLQAHQDRISAIVASKEAILHAPGAPDTAALARLRWELVRALSAYRLFKHTQLFDRLATRGSPAQAALAAEMKAACAVMEEDLRAYVRQWSGVAVTDAWASYRPAALAMMRRLGDHLARERGEAMRLLGSGLAQASAA